MIKVETTIASEIKKVWEFFTSPNHIINWYFASEDWHCPRAKNDLQLEGKFNFRMEAKNDKIGFDFEGRYTNIEMYKTIEYILEDNRKVKIIFEDQDNKTKVVELFDPENQNPEELQRMGWQSILDNFKRYCEKK